MRLEELGTNEGALYLAGEGAALTELTGLSGGDLILWVRGHDRRLYGPVVSAEERMWDGVETTEEKAARFGLEARSVADFDADLGSALMTLDEIHFPFGAASFAARVLALVGRKRRFRAGDVVLRDLRDRLGLMRACKTSAELEKMRLAGRKSGEAHEILLRTDWIGAREKDVALRFDLEIRRRGIEKTAYETIVGAGDRAMILHARASERIVKDGDLILVDAGGLWEGYCADITRTFPAGRAFTTAQRKLYSIVLAAQKRAIAAVKPGATLDDIHRQAREDMMEGLRREGWLQAAEQMDRWFPHNTSHWLGMQVHDPSPYRERNGEPVRLREGMVLTIEPGLYLRGNDAPAEVRGLGVRIEDDVAVTATGAEVLTSSAPKEIEEIESLRALQEKR